MQGIYIYAPETTFPEYVVVVVKTYYINTSCPRQIFRRNPQGMGPTYIRITQYVFMYSAGVKCRE